MAYLVMALALSLPLVMYYWASLRTPASRVSTLADYFVAFRRLDAPPFANSSLAYAFQVATLFPFLYWGIQGEILPAIVNAACWGIGILIFRQSLPSVLAALDDHQGPHTLHGILGRAYDSIGVQRISAGITILGMMGIALAEAYWGMQIITVLVPSKSMAYNVIILTALLFVLSYMWYGGTWGSMKTDMLQLVFAYLSFTGVFIFLILKIVAGRMSVSTELTTIAALMLVGAAASVFIRVRHHLSPVVSMPVTSASPTKEIPDREYDDKVWNSMARILSVFTLVALLAGGLFFAWVMIKGWGNWSFAPLMDPGGPKWKGVIALATLGILFQFVDMSAWQRLQSLSGAGATLRNAGRRGLLLFGIESPFSWILCLALGALFAICLPELKTAEDAAGPLASFPRLMLTSGGAIHVAVAFLFMIGVMGVMLSTIDSALLASMYAFAADIQRLEFGPGGQAGGKVELEQARLLQVGKRSGAGLVLAIAVGVGVLGAILNRQQELISILVGFYGAMLSMFPAVFFMLRGRPRLSGKSIALGMLTGALGALAFTIWGLFNADRGWDAIFAGPVLAAVVTPLAHLLSPWRHSK